MAGTERPLPHDGGDAIVVVEFPTKEAALKARLTVAQASGVEEARPHFAFPENESRAIIDELGG
jgi:uncharacterized protein with GYD domain